MSLGKLVYKYYYEPTLPYRYKLHHFGLKSCYEMWKGEKDMKLAAVKLAPLNLSDQFLLECSYLTGESYWHQTIFCAYSLALLLDFKVKINVYSDGTLTKKHIDIFHSVFPQVCVINEDDIITNLNEKLPENKYPHLRYLRNFSPFFRKLVDMRLNDRYIIQLDSDMLFFNNPNELIKAYNTTTYYYMEDKTNLSNYVLPEIQIENHFGFKIKEKINSGILAYNSAAIDWNFVEYACGFLLSKVTHIYPIFEQTINAIILSKINANPLNKDYNIIYSDEESLNSKTEIVRHYIFKAKEQYLTKEWKKIA